MAPLAAPCKAGASQAAAASSTPAPRQRLPVVSDEVCVVPTDDVSVAATTDRASVATPRRPGPRIDGATLLHRVWNVDALKCPRCEGAMKFIATITGRAVIVRILTHLRIPTE